MWGRYVSVFERRAASVPSASQASQVVADCGSSIAVLASGSVDVVAVIVRKDDVDAVSPASTGLRANFVAPLVINVGERIGMQKVINRLGCEITLRAQG